jgi:hypothetical protein
VNHSFLLESGSWNLNGNWLKQDRIAIPIQGTLEIAWKRDNWFTIAARLKSQDEFNPEITYKYRGHLDFEEKHYTYVLHHNLLGNLEGEGWIAVQSIVQCSWAVSSSQSRRGFESFYLLDPNTYCFTSSILEGHNLNSSMEATLKRQS